MAVKYHSYPDGRSYIAPPLHVVQKSGSGSIINPRLPLLQNLHPTFNILFSHVRETDISFCFLPLSASVRDRGSPQTVHRAGWKFSTRNFLTFLNFFLQQTWRDMP